MDREAEKNTPEENRTNRHYEVQAAFTGSNDQTGPFVDLCYKVLGGCVTGRHRERKILMKTHVPMTGSEITVLDSQLNGAV